MDEITIDFRLGEPYTGEEKKLMSQSNRPSYNGLIVLSRDTANYLACIWLDNMTIETEKLVKMRIKMLVDGGINIDSIVYQSLTLISYFVQNRNHLQVKLLLSMGISVEEVTGEGLTPLMYAVQNNCAYCADLLLTHGAEINARDYISKRTALHIAVISDKPEMMVLLLDKNADTDAAYGPTSITPLVNAIVSKNILCVQILLDAHVNVNEPNNMLVNHPLYRACEQGTPDIVTKLIGAGARFNYSTTEIKTYLKDTYYKNNESGEKEESDILISVLQIKKAQE